MNFQEVLNKSRPLVGPHCKACLICDGRACCNQIPGPGSKGSGRVATRNYEGWQDVFVKMDTIVPKGKIDTTLTLFGKTFKYPIFAGPVGAVAMHYSDLYSDQTFYKTLLAGAKKAGICAFTGDGMDPAIMIDACQEIKNQDGLGVPTIKPWPKEIVLEKLELVKNSKAFMVAMDIDAAGLPFLKSFTPPAGRKSVQELKEIIDASPVPFMLKGIMSEEGAIKALEAGAKAIVVSNHGGRVLDGTPSSASVLEKIAKVVDGKIKIFVDGGLRSGVDIFKALAMGADAVLVARPFVNAVYGAGEEGVEVLVETLGQELKDTMEMCGASDLASIDKTMITR